MESKISKIVAEVQKKSRGNRKLILEFSEDKIYVVFYTLHSFCDYLKNNERTGSRYLRFNLGNDGLWKLSESTCCNYPKATENDIPVDWQSNLKFSYKRFYARPKS